MSTIVSASFARDAVPQADGRYWLAETFTYDDGSTATSQYLVESEVDYQARLDAHVAAMNAAAAAQAAAVPPMVSSIQARRAINEAGLKAAVEAAIAAADSDVQNIWYTAAIVERNNAILLAMAAAVGLSSDQVDALFRHAAEL